MLLESKSVNQSLRYLVKYTPRGNPIISSFPMAIYSKRMPNRFVSKWSFFGEKHVLFFAVQHFYDRIKNSSFVSITASLGDWLCRTR
jgi:hypothetical protein